MSLGLTYLEYMGQQELTSAGISPEEQYEEKKKLLIKKYKKMLRSVRKRLKKLNRPKARKASRQEDQVRNRLQRQEDALYADFDKDLKMLIKNYKVRDSDSLQNYEGYLSGSMNLDMKGINNDI